MASYAGRVRADIQRWQASGLIDAATAAALSREVEAHQRRSLSFGTILATLAAVLLGAALLIFIAAGWETIPRLWRVGMLFALLLFGYCGGAWLKNRDHGALGEGLWLVAAAGFGGSVGLIGQMYHFSGDESGAVLLWFCGVLVAAAALRSAPLTAASAALAAAWLFLTGFDFWTRDRAPHLFLLLALGVWAVSLWTGSRPARHLVLLSLVAYALMLGFEFHATAAGLALAAISAALFTAAVLLPEPVERATRLDGALPVHALLGFIAGMFMLQTEVHDELGLFLPAAVLTFAGTVAAVMLAGRESRGVRWLGYLGFTVEICIVYAVTMGTMLGSAGLFLASGVVLAVAAVIIIRLEKRLASPGVPAGVPA